MDLTKLEFSKKRTMFDLSLELGAITIREFDEVNPNTSFQLLSTSGRVCCLIAFYFDQEKLVNNTSAANSNWACSKLPALTNLAPS